MTENPLLKGGFFGFMPVPKFKEEKREPIAGELCYSQVLSEI